MSIQDVKYSVQLNLPDIPWSEWRPVTQPMKEDTILSLRYDREVTEEENREILKMIGLSS